MLFVIIKSYGRPVLIPQLFGRFYSVSTFVIGRSGWESSSQVSGSCWNESGENFLLFDVVVLVGRVLIVYERYKNKQIIREGSSKRLVMLSFSHIKNSNTIDIYYNLDTY